jgi:hypothetical protein
MNNYQQPKQNPGQGSLLVSRFISRNLTDQNYIHYIWNTSFWRVVTMVNNTRNFWVSGLYPSSGVWRNMTFRKLDRFPSSGKRGEEDTYSDGPHRKRTETDPVSEMSCSFKHRTMDKVQKFLIWNTVNSQFQDFNLACIYIKEDTSKYASTFLWLSRL